jgi:hypothetical protein
MSRRWGSRQQVANLNTSNARIQLAKRLTQQRNGFAFIKFLAIDGSPQ